MNHLETNYDKEELTLWLFLYTIVIPLSEP